jgi:hypothetical protein
MAGNKSKSGGCGKTVARCGVNGVAVLMHVHSKKPKQMVFSHASSF